MPWRLVSPIHQQTWYWFCAMWIFLSSSTRDVWVSVNGVNWSNSQIPQRTGSISRNAPFRIEMGTTLLSMVHCGIRNQCTVRFVRLVLCKYVLLGTTRVRVKYNHQINLTTHLKLAGHFLYIYNPSTDQICIYVYIFITCIYLHTFIGFVIYNYNIWRLNDIMEKTPYCVGIGPVLNLL